MKLDNSDMVTLEGLIDKSDVTEVLELIVRICGEKAEHLMANWQAVEGDGGVQAWQRTGLMLDRLIQKLGA